MNHPHDILDPAFLKRLEYLDFVAKKIAGGEFRGERSAPSQGRAVEFREHRTYAPGDDTRYIDWNVYLRLNELHIKEFEAEENLNIAVVVDVSASMDHGKHNKRLYALRMAAALGYIGLSNFDSVFVAPHPISEKDRPVLLRGKGQRNELLRRLSHFEGGGAGRLADTVRTIPRPRRGTLLVAILSDFYDEDGFQSAFDQVRARRARGMAVHLIDPLDLEPEQRGTVRLRDLETGQEHVLELTPGMLERYRREFDIHRLRLERYCLDAEFGFARVDTTVPFDASLLSILRRSRILK